MQFKSRRHPQVIRWKYTAGFSATTMIRRSDYGMHKYIPEIGDEIAIRLDIEGQRGRSET
ncbi:MAG: YceI family protein [Xanthomonadales bacterium]|nr:YceI family protein [Xanthomonadales bacterium]